MDFSQMRDYLRELSEQPLLFGKNLIELLKYKNRSLYWFFEWFVYHGNAHIPNLYSLDKEPLKIKYYLGKMKLVRTITRKATWIPFSLFRKQRKAKYIAFISTLNQTVYNPDTESIVNDELFLPLVYRLEKKNNVLVINIPYKREIFGFWAYLRGVGKSYDFVPIESFMSIKLIKSAYNQYKNYLNIWNHVKSNGSLDYLNHKENTVKLLDYFFSSYLLVIILRIEAYSELFKKYKVDLLCSYDAFSQSGFEPRVAFNGKMLAIPHGIWGPTEDSEFAHSSIDISTYPLTDYAITFNDQMKEFISKANQIPEDNVYIVDNYKKEELYHKMRKYNLEYAPEAITLVSHPMEDNKDELRAILDIAYSFLKEVGGNIIIRPHPSEDDTIHKEYIGKYNIQCLISRVEDIVYPLSRSKLVIGVPSTVLSEAEQLGIPAIVIDIHDKGYSQVYSNIWSVKNKEELIKKYSEVEIDPIQNKPTCYNKMVEIIEGIAA